MLLHILTAIEDSDLAEELCKLLRQKDVAIEPVSVGKTFWEDAEKKTSDLLLVSREYVTGKGLERISGLLEASEAPAVVVLTEYEDDKDRAELIASGCEAVLNTSLPSEKVVEAIEAILDRRRDATAGVLSIPKPHQENRRCPGLPAQRPGTLRRLAAHRTFRSMRRRP